MAAGVVGRAVTDGGGAAGATTVPIPASVGDCAARRSAA